MTEFKVRMELSEDTGWASRTHGSILLTIEADDRAGAQRCAGVLEDALRHTDRNLHVWVHVEAEGDD